MLKLFRKSIGLIAFIIIASIIGSLISALAYAIGFAFVPPEILFNPITMVVVQLGGFILGIMLMFVVFD